MIRSVWVWECVSYGVWELLGLGDWVNAGMGVECVGVCRFVSLVIGIWDLIGMYW